MAKRKGCSRNRKGIIGGKGGCEHIGVEKKWGDI
jgi:hypothetical protein